MSLLLNKGFIKKILKNKVFFLISLLVFISSIMFLLGFTLDDGKSKEEGFEEKDELVSVEKFEVYESKLLQDISSFGTISYSGKNDVTVQVQGLLKKLHVQEGDKVVKGQVLAEIENIQLELQRQQGISALKSAQAEVNLARTRLEEGRLAVESNLLNLEKLELQLKHQGLELEEAQLELEKQEKLLALGGITPAAYRSQQVAVEGQRAAYEIAQKEYERQSLGLRNEDLLQKGIEPGRDLKIRRQQLIELNTRTLQASLDSALATLDSAKKNLESIEEVLSLLVVPSPKDGVVAVKYFEQGEFIKENEKILTIMDIHEVHAVFSIQEQDVGHFFLGSPVEVEIPALGLKITSPIKEISPMADAESGNFTLKSYLKNEDELMKPGMFVKCLIPRDSSVLPTIPESALIEEIKTASQQWQGRVFAIHQGRAVKKEVEVLDRADGMVWIAKGLEAGDYIIDNPSPFLKEGQIVN